jgi:hypothetical protein
MPKRQLVLAVVRSIEGFAVRETIEESRAAIILDSQRKKYRVFYFSPLSLFEVRTVSI